MKKVLLLLCLAGACCVQAQARQDKMPKIAVVSLESIFTKYQKAIDLRRGLDADMQRARKDMEARKQQLETWQGELQRLLTESQNLSLNEQGRANAKALLETKAREFEAQRESYVNSARTSETLLQQRQQQMIKTVNEDMQPAIVEIAKKKNLDLVIPTNAALYFDPAFDISDELITILNAGYIPVAPPSTPAVSAPAAPATTAPAATVPKAATR